MLRILALIILISLCLCDISTLLTNNQNWANTQTASNANYFSAHSSGQSPTYLWIGCSDSRVPPNEILGLDLG